MIPQRNRLFSSHEAAELLQMDPSSVVKWVNEGKLPAFLTPGGHRRIRQDDLIRFLRQHQMYVPAELQVPTHVLVVDDDENLLKALTRAAKGHDDLKLSSCTNGVDALVWIGAERPDVLVLDIQMPGLDGLDVLKALKASPATKGIEVIVVTGKPTFELERKVRELGGKAVLGKPLSLPVLRAALGARSDAS